MIQPPRPFGPHPMLPNPHGLEPRFALPMESTTRVDGIAISIVQRKRAAERGLLLEGDVALRCACGNRDSAPSFWFTSRVHPRIECSAECGRFMELDVEPA